MISSDPDTLTFNDLTKNPRWDASHLGWPMPDSRHAVSACLPLWEHNIGYEEGDPDVMDRLQAAYPRFCLNPIVRNLCDQIFQPRHATGLVFPSRRAAQRAVDYVQCHGGVSAHLVELPGQFHTGVAVSSADFPWLKQYWQHAGEITSSRAAEQILAGQRVATGSDELSLVIRQRIAELQSVDHSHVWLYASGMAAMAAAWRAMRACESTGASVQFGFPYVDTLKIQQRFPPASCRFFPVGSDQDIACLETELKHQKVSAVFCEAPANPLLTCPDLHRLRKLANEFGFVLVIDDTLAACTNLDIVPLADIVVTSLTKYFSGYGDVLAGSVVLNPESQHYPQLQQALVEDYECLLANADLQVLEENSRDVRGRVETINRNAAALAERLSRHARVDRVFYPSLETHSASDRQHYDAVRRPDGGYGGLLSVVLKDAENVTPRVFDALQICKGPNLGTVFTLCCPYTILAHYNELDFVESCGVSRWLLRFSIGIEPLEDLWQRLQQVLNMADVSPAKSP